LARKNGEMRRSRDAVSGKIGGLIPGNVGI
jgi:hypothetical protein